MQFYYSLKEVKSAAISNLCGAHVAHYALGVPVYQM